MNKILENSVLITVVADNFKAYSNACTSRMNNLFLCWKALVFHYANSGKRIPTSKQDFLNRGGSVEFGK